MQRITPAQKFFLLTFLNRRMVRKLPAAPSMSAAEWTGVLGETPIETTRYFLGADLVRRIGLADYLNAMFDYSQIKELAIGKGVSLEQGKKELINHILLRVDHQELWGHILALHLVEKFDYHGLIAHLNRAEFNQLSQWAKVINNSVSLSSHRGRKNLIHFLTRQGSVLDLWDLVLGKQHDERHDYSQVRDVLRKYHLSANGTVGDLIARLQQNVPEQLLWDLVLDFTYLELTSEGVSVAEDHLLEMKYNQRNNIDIERWLGMSLGRVKLILAFVGGAAITGIIGNRADEALSVLIEDVIAVLHTGAINRESNAESQTGLFEPQYNSGAAPRIPTTHSSPTPPASDPTLTLTILAVLAGRNIFLFLKRLLPKHKKR